MSRDAPLRWHKVDLVDAYSSPFGVFHWRKLPKLIIPKEQSTPWKIQYVPSDTEIKSSTLILSGKVKNRMASITFQQFCKSVYCSLKIRITWLSISVAFWHPCFKQPYTHLTIVLWFPWNFFLTLTTHRALRPFTHSIFMQFLCSCL